MQTAPSTDFVPARAWFPIRREIIGKESLGLDAYRYTLNCGHTFIFDPVMVRRRKRKPDLGHTIVCPYCSRNPISN